MHFPTPNDLKGILFKNYFVLVTDDKIMKYQFQE